MKIWNTSRGCRNTLNIWDNCIKWITRCCVTTFIFLLFFYFCFLLYFFSLPKIIKDYFSAETESGSLQLLLLARRVLNAIYISVETTVSKMNFPFVSRTRQSFVGDLNEPCEHNTLLVSLCGLSEPW